MKKHLSLLLAICMAAGLLSGCTGEKPGDDSGDTTPPSISDSGNIVKPPKKNPDPAVDKNQLPFNDPLDDTAEDGDDTDDGVQTITPEKQLDSYGIFNSKYSPNSTSGDALAGDASAGLDFTGATRDGSDSVVTYTGDIPSTAMAIGYESIGGADRDAFDAGAKTYYDGVQKALQKNFSKVFNNPTGFEISGLVSSPAGRDENGCMMTYQGVNDTSKDSHVYVLQASPKGKQLVSYSYMCILDVQDLEALDYLDVGSITMLGGYLTGLGVKPADLRQMIGEAYDMLHGDSENVTGSSSVQFSSANQDHVSVVLTQTPGDADAEIMLQVNYEAWLFAQ